MLDGAHRRRCRARQGGQPRRHAHRRSVRNRVLGGREGHGPGRRRDAGRDLASGVWNKNFWDSDYDARLAVVLVGAALAVASAWARERARQGAQRLALLDEVGAIADGSLPLAQTLERVIEVIVPAFADFCMIDAIHDQRVMRSAVRARGAPAGEGPRDGAAPRRARAEPSRLDGPARGAVPAPATLHPEVQRRGHAPASPGRDLDWLRGLGLRSSITVAMLARDRMLGALTLNTAWSGRRYALDDVRFAQALAGRVALALDNAGLFSDLESVERRMDNVMSILDEGIVIHDSQGELVFANPAATSHHGHRACGPRGRGAGLVAQRDSIYGRFLIRAEDGSPLEPEQLAGRRALAGRPDGAGVARGAQGGRPRAVADHPREADHGAGGAAVLGDGDRGRDRGQARGVRSAAARERRRGPLDVDGPSRDDSRPRRGAGPGLRRLVHGGGPGRRREHRAARDCPRGSGPRHRARAPSAAANRCTSTIRPGSRRS